MVTSAMHAHTPKLMVCEARGLIVRLVLLHRTETAEVAVSRVTRQRFDPAGRMITATDPRLTSPNQRTVYSLGGSTLATESVDAGWRVALFGEAGQVLNDWDARGSERQFEYDLLLRTANIVEQNRCAERFTYGQADAAGHNQCNQLIRHDDTAGSRLLPDYGLLGAVLSETRHFMLVSAGPDWPPAEPDRDALLEPVGLQSRWAFNAQGEALAQTDAMANTQAFGMTVAGQLKAASLTLAGASPPQTLVGDIHYNAFNQVEQETAGNGVVSRYTYDQQDGRLTELSAVSADGTVLQKLDYDHDPVGNVLLVSDTSQADRYCDNQLIEPISRFAYDTLYQLIEASGREVRNSASHGPALPGLQPIPTLDPCQVSNYTQSYSYDTAGNLLQMRHEGAHNFTRNMHVAPDNNRSLPDDDGEVDFATSFDANGNLLQLLRGQVMGWDVRNQLQRITTVQREDGPNDEERYVYDGQGQRCRKISTAQASGRTLINEVRYLPGLEIRTTADGEILHVITAQAGRSSVRVLHWDAGKPGAIANDQVRYSLSDHLGSSTLELDQQGGLISQESYYPFGGTAWWAARSAVEAKYKTVRYSGKERDASGLSYYGFRYYASWFYRWISPDPAGPINGLNLFIFVGNMPITHNDLDGRVYEGTGDFIENAIHSKGDTILFRGLSEFPEELRGKLTDALEETHNIYQNALSMINQYPSKTTRIMRSFYGYEHKNMKTHIVKSWAQSHSLVSDYKTGLGSDKFIGITASNNQEAAYIFREDPLGRIAVNTNQMEKKQLAITLGHEISHLKSVNGFSGTGPESEDYFYIFESAVSKLVGGGNTLELDNYQAVAEVITGGGLSRSYFSTFEGLAEDFKEQVEHIHPDNKIIPDLDTAILEFNRNPSIVAEMSSDNADSQILSAYGLHKNYKKHLTQP
ncbi:RHS repeat-associated core domain-containing protein [Pseudomonas syringae]|uniref:RHS repeat-associated core domain-containing protein n=6 Tax=Pseudomonas syringae TaxID=317 RepID=UPI001F40FF6D|nr:RHS repeat-associated core domain-containing protein [Pseudomonas syringae]